MRRASLLLLAAAAIAKPARAQVDARMFRYPDVSATQIAFVYAGDIWVAPKTGGSAERLSSPAGEESFPRFSPDGSHIAFTGNYDGNADVYVVPTQGGTPVRVTHHPDVDRLIDWYPDGKSLLIASGMASGTDRFNQLYRVAAAGGLPERLPVAYGEFAALSPDASQIIYMPQTNDFRTWKRYRGGWAPDLWMFDLKTYASERLTDNPGNDAQPMWHGRTLYFLSDRDQAERNNLWALDLDKHTFRELTHFTDFDITFPAIGPTDIVFQAGGRLYLFDLASEQAREVSIKVVTDEATLRPRSEKVAGLIQTATPGPGGQRALFEARGDLFTVPAEHGPTRNLTASSGVAERWPAWSPDGKTIGYWSDRSGEYELYTRPADGSAPEKKITSYGPGFRYHLFWSPDSKRVAFVDQAMGIHICEIATGRTTDVDQNHFMFEGNLEAFTVSWSPDSRWLAYTKDLRQTSSAIGLFDLRSGKATQVTSGFYGDFSPAFDPDGKYLYFLSGRTFEPLYSNVDNSWVYPYNVDVVAVPLTRATASPLVTRSDEEKADTTAKPDTTKSAAKPAKPDQKKKEPAATPADTAKAKGPAPVDIDLDGFEERLVALPPRAGNYADLQAVSGGVIYRRFAAAASGDSASPVLIWDLKSREESVVVDNADQATLTADGKKLLVAKRDRYAFVEPKPKQKVEKWIETGGMEAMVDPRAEWRQMFNDVWRFERDLFYDPGMHGVDWNAMRTRYGTLLDDAVTRWDVNFVIGELIAELNSSHTYRGGGDLQVPPSRGVGLLGVDWSIENGAARIARIIDGAPWDNEVRSPLREPGVSVKQGDYVLAVNGVPLDPRQDPWAAFQGLAGKAVELTVNDKPTMAGARKVLVTTLSDESRLRNLAWIESNRERVEQATGGKVGYIYVPNTGTDGQTELVRQFSGQFDKAGLVVDERFNSGGQIPDRFIELLNRPALSYWAVRDGTDWQWPPVANFGPKVMLINGWSGSGGDAFPYYFKEAKLGPLIGLRTWGGLIGISGAPTLVDGGGVTVPTFRMYGTNGAWFAEGHGVDPDIVIVDDPTALAKGQDPQLERGVAEVLRMLKEQPPTGVKRPAYENRTPKP